jgi:RsiW-degrading membrane proteinase PrsW (M82 family)
MDRQNFEQLSRWSWLKILVGGVLLFILLERALVATSNINYLPSLLLIGTFTVPVAFCAFLYTRVKTPDVPWLTLGLCALWGGVLGTVVAGRLEYDTAIRLGTLPTLAIGIIEEISKLLIPAYFLSRRRYRSVYDGIVIGAATGAGFAAFESLGYAFVALFISHGNITAIVQVLLFRSLMAPAAHIAWTALLSGALWYLAYGTGNHKLRYLIYTLTGVVLLHALWDSVTFLLGYVILGVISLIWLTRRTYRAERTMLET